MLQVMHSLKLSQTKIVQFEFPTIKMLILVWLLQANIARKTNLIHFWNSVWYYYFTTCRHSLLKQRCKASQNIFLFFCYKLKWYLRKGLTLKIYSSGVLKIKKMKKWLCRNYLSFYPSMGQAVLYSNRKLFKSNSTENITHLIYCPW